MSKVMEECYSKFDRQLTYNMGNVTRGRMICVDPGSTKVGIAIYEAGKLVDSMQLAIPGKIVNQRLKTLGHMLRALPPADVLVVEYIHHWNKLTKPAPYVRLLRSIGTIVSSIDWTYCLEIAPIVWKDIVELDLRGKNGRTDEEEAILIGKAVLDRAAIIAEGDPDEIMS